MYLANALLAIGIATNVRTLNDDRHESMVRFLKWTLINENPGWGVVLNEKMKGLEQPPYADEFASNGAKIMPQSAIDDDELFNARLIVVNVAYNYSTVGSFVKYAVTVIQKSFMCFAAKHLAFQMQYMSLLIQQEMHVTIMTVASELKNYLVQIIDKLAIAEIDLSLLLKTYWQMINIMKYDMVSQVRMDPLPESIKRTVEDLHKQYVDYRKDHCSGYKLSSEFFYDIKMKLENTLIVEEILDTTLTKQQLSDMGQAHLMFLMQFCSNLNYNNMSTTMWSQVFYSSNRSEPIDELDKVNPPISK